jgi:hypothetical protein
LVIVLHYYFLSCLGLLRISAPLSDACRALDTCLSCRSLPGRQTFGALNKVSEKSWWIAVLRLFFLFILSLLHSLLFQARQNRTENSALSDFYSGELTHENAHEKT